MQIPSVFEKKTWIDYSRTPCVKASYLTATGCAGLMISHQLRLHRGNLLRATIIGTFTFLTTCITNFSICITDFKKRQEMYDQVFRKQNVKELKDLPKEEEIVHRPHGYTSK